MALSREDDVGGSKPFVFEGMCCNLQSTVEGHFSRILWMWLFTVKIERLSRRAISLLLIPSAMRTTISRSRFVIRTALGSVPFPFRSAMLDYVSEKRSR